MLLLLTALLGRLPDAPAPSPPRWVLRVVQEAAVAAELMDRRECASYLFVRPDEFRVDLRFLANRAAELRGAPPLSASLLFPERWLVLEMLAFNRCCQDHLSEAEGFDPLLAEDTHAALLEAQQLYALWDKVADARNEDYFTASRRRVLKAIRDAIGPEAFWAGRLPPHIPVWRLRRAN